MMGPIINAVLISCFTLFVVCAWKVVNMLWVTPKRLEKHLRAQGFNGNKYRFFYGDLKEYGKMQLEAKSKPIEISGETPSRVLPFQNHVLKKYGKNFIVWFGWRPIVHIMEPELIKEIVMNPNEFQKKKSNPLTKPLLTGVLICEGDKWAKHRKILNPGFRLDKVKTMLPAFELSCNELIEKWEKMLSTKKSHEVDVMSDFQTLTSDVISRTSFGSSYEEGARIFELITELTKHVYSTFKSVYLPGMRFLPTKRNVRMKTIKKEIDILLKKIIDKKLKAMMDGNSDNTDLLGMMLQTTIEDTNHQGMTIDEVMDECRLFYFAGQESTAMLLVWTMILLSKHQEWQSRAREEVMDVFGNKPIDCDGLNRLNVMGLIINEVLRLYPPAFGVSREINRDIKVGGHTMPLGTDVNLPIMLLHYDKEIWGEDAHEFNPDRFSGGVVKATKGMGGYVPFGGGPRICIGQHFSMLESKLVLSKLLKHFYFEISPSYVHAPHTVITLQPQYGAQLIIRKL